MLKKISGHFPGSVKKVCLIFESGRPKVGIIPVSITTNGRKMVEDAKKIHHLSSVSSCLLPAEGCKTENESGQQKRWV